MKFQSKFANYKVWVKPSQYQVDPVGNRYFVQGLFAQFENGFFQTEDQELIDGLKKNPFYGVDFWSLDEEKVEVSSEGQKIVEDIAKEKETLTDCPVCGQSFKSKLGLLSHMKYKHKQ
jgi:hypothetical protein